MSAGGRYGIGCGRRRRIVVLPLPRRRLGLLSLVLAIHPAAAPPPPIAAAPREDRAGWTARFAAKQRELRAAPPALVFYGDSNIQRMTSSPRQAGGPFGDLGAVWRHYYGDRAAVNLGYSGDGAGHLLWRIGNGEATGIAPKLAVVMIGTNDLNRRQPPEAVVAAIGGILDALRQRLPGTPILLLGVLPGNGRPALSDAAAATNRLLAARYAAAPGIAWLDPAAAVPADRAAEFFGDALHLNAQGFARLAAAIEPMVAERLGDQARPPLP
ncbi:MAG: Lipase/Acylhydrolase family protein [Belnapia sp.]|nr:Lipase/Acylhydrolase family protein [Belnapia sp.]